MSSDPHENPRKGTGQLDSSRLTFESMLPAQQRQQEEAQGYLPLPKHLANIQGRAELPAWRIELHGLSQDAAPLGLTVLGDVVIGRGAKGEPAPDLSLETYKAGERGVSRRHALIRPTTSRLFLFDLNSTNGTLVNAMPLGSGMARALHDKDIITMGGMSFTIRIIRGPGEYVAEEAEQTESPGDSADRTKPLNERRSKPD